MTSLKKINQKKELEMLMKTNNIIGIVRHNNLNFQKLENTRRFSDNIIIKKFKNKIIKLTFKDTIYSSLNIELEKENLIFFAKNILEICKAINFIKQNNNKIVQIKLVQGNLKTYDQTEILDISNYNSTDQLQSNLLGVINNISGFIINIIDLLIERNKN